MSIPGPGIWYQKPIFILDTVEQNGTDTFVQSKI